MKKVLNVLVDAFLYAFYMLISCITVRLAEWFLLSLMYGKIFSVYFTVSPFALCIIRATIYTLGVNAILAIVAYRDGYKSPKSSIGGALFSSAIATMIHFPVALLFGFGAFCSGGVKFITALIYFGTQLNSEGFSGELYRIDYIPYFFANAVIYCVIIAIFKKLGSIKRIKDRAELTKENQIKGESI